MVCERGPRELGLLSLEKRRLRKDLTVTCHYLMHQHNRGRASLFLELHGVRIRGNVQVAPREILVR